MKKIKKGFIIIVGFLNLISIIIHGQNPVSSFSANQTSGCSPLTVQFTNTSLNAASYYWDFGNGNTSVLINPSNVYANAGTYSVKLIATGVNGQKDSILSNNIITVSSNSIPGFHAVKTISCLDGNIFSFVNTSINATSYQWDFGDGTTSTLLNPSHTYVSAGTYTIKLITYDSYGCPSLKIMPNYIQVNQNPLTDFSVNTNTTCNLNQVFNFTSATPQVNSWTWDFGDSNTSTLENPNHTYSTAGSYDVALTSTNTNGCSNTLTFYNYILIATPETPVFSANTTSGCFPLAVTFTNSSFDAVSWLWDFGDGNTSTDQNPSHIYSNSGNYNVSLTITNYNNCTYTTTRNNFITISNKAVSDFSLSNESGCAPVTIHFTNQSTNAVSWLWEFGDGYTSTLQNPSHSYTTNGSYNVLLHSYNASGCEAVYQRTNAVVLSLPNAQFNTNYTPGCAPLTANFTNTSINAVQWLWNFGDGTTSTLQNPSHTYNLPGDYTVSLIAFDSHGCSDTLSLNSYIHVINTAGNYIPPATINGCVPFNTSFSNNTSGAVSWLWDFGDGTNSTQQNPAHTYLTSGFYTVSLTVHLTGGCIQFYPNFRTFNIKGGQAAFTFTSQTQCAPYIVNFSGTTLSNWASGSWNFGDGQTAVIQNPIHTYASPGTYTVTYKTTTTEGCTSSIIESNCIHFSSCTSTSGGGGNNGGTGNTQTGTGTGTSTNIPPPTLNSCIPFTIQFNNTFPGATSWLWNFGDGTTSTLQNPFHTYSTIGIYSVMLIAHSSTGTNDTVKYPNYIHASGINTDFSFTENGSCENTTLTFTSIAPAATSWHWDFNDGTTSTQQNPVHTYSNSNNDYSISLTTSNSLGCSGSISKNPSFAGATPVIVANNYSTCVNQVVNFNCFPSGFASYLWTFGDGATSVLQNPTHSYSTGGAFQVSLKVTDNNGCLHLVSLQNLVTVNNPIANFTSALINGCNSKTVNFSNTSTGISLPISAHCKWSFGDGSLEQWSANPTHTYSASGIYQATLTVNQNNSCFNSLTKTVHVHPIIANFSYTQSSMCFPVTATYTDSSSSSAVSWLWDFGDGITSTLQNPTHLFTIPPITDVTLTVTDANGCTATITKPNITFFYTDFWVSATEGCAPVDIPFSDASSNAIQWKWNFGDGTTSTEQNPTHTYLNSGIFVVTLISSSSNGCHDTAVFNAMNINNPVANFISANPTNCSPALVSFTDSSLNATSWLWDFGDGSSSTIRNPGHIYNIPGVYTIKLIVANDNGCTDSLTRVNYIKVPGTIANFTASDTQSCLQSTLQFSDFSINASSWNWNFGDGNTSTQKNPSNIYQHSGQYTVSLIVHDLQGCSSSFTLANPITINPLPIADFTVSNTISCTPFPVSFQNHSQNASSYLWNFGDGTTATAFSPSHTYSNYGTYTATLTTTNQFGCTATKIISPIIAKETPTINFTTNTSEGCPPLTVVFNNLTNNTQNAIYSWDFNNGLTSNQQNPTNTYTKPGLYPVSLIVTNSNGCSDTVTKTGYIEVYDLNPPPKSTILAVTVVSDASVQIIWNQNTANDFAFYEIYKKDILTGNYISIGTINNRSITTYTDDHNLNTPVNSYCYKIQTVDICGNRLPLDSLQEHCTVNVSAIGVNKNIKVKWTPYIGASVSTYSVYRMEATTAAPILVTTVPSTVLTINDTTIACPFYYSYRIKANNLNGNTISSNSDTCIAKPTDNDLLHQKIEVVRSTVVDNSKVLTEWKAPVVASEKVTGYAIYRSTDNANFSLLTTISSALHEYIDSDVDVNTQNYYYKIKAMNACDVDGITSNKSSSILLKAELLDGDVHLNWTGYDGWNMGVDYYIIEKKDENGEWKTIKKVDGNTLIYKDEN